MKPHELAFATALVLGIFTGCSVGTAPKARAASCCSTNLKDAVAFTDRSLYQVDSTWTTDTGQKIKLGSLQGPVQVVVMFFSSCQYACPLLVHDLKMIEAKLPETVRAHTGFVLISFDTMHDTPEVLRGYRTRQQLPDGRWTLLRGNADDTLEMAALLGVKFKKGADGQFAHSNVITILNPEGEIIHQQIGLGQNLIPAVKAIEVGYSECSNSNCKDDKRATNLEKRS